MPGDRMTSPRYTPDPQRRACTVQQLADYLAWQSMVGRGQHTVKIDERGLAFLTMEHKDVNLVTPPDGGTHDETNKVVFISARF